jgi:hypothetical protein
MYYSPFNMSALGQEPCSELQAKHNNWLRLSTPRGGRSKTHQKEAKIAAKKIKVQLDACLQDASGVAIIDEAQEPAAPGAIWPVKDYIEPGQEGPWPVTGSAPTSLLPPPKASPVKLLLIGAVIIGGVYWWNERKRT